MAGSDNQSGLEKARLVPVLTDFLNPDKSRESEVMVVQFNPETLKVSYTNQIQQPEGTGDKRGNQGLLFVGAGTTKMSCTLWFDVTAPQPPQANGSAGAADDVRQLTNRIANFIKPGKNTKDKKTFMSRPVRFEWGSFWFAGVLESVEESLEFFSPQGKPLRASVAIAMSQQQIIIFTKDPNKTFPGTSPTTPVPQGSSLQKMAGPNWQSIASSNGIENPRLPAPGTRLNLAPTE